MTRVLVLGATGGVGSRLVTHLLERGDDVLALHRRPGQAEQLHAAGVTPVLGDLTVSDAATLAGHLDAVDAVVFAAGAADQGPRQADLIDGRGVQICAAAAAAAGCSRFLLVSAFPDAWRDRRMPEDFEHYMKVKRQADVYLAGTDLDWVIVRPGTLTDSAGTGRVRLGPAIPYGEVPRDDVAAVLTALLHQDGVTRTILELTTGTTPIAEAVKAQARP